VISQQPPKIFAPILLNLIQILANLIGVKSLRLPNCTLGLFESGFQPAGICSNAFILKP
jgi:hypothetical protein